MSKLTLPPPFSDLPLRETEVPATLSDARAHGVLWQAAPGRFLLNMPDVARYLVEDGHQITVQTYKNASEEDVLRLLHMAPMAALAYQRGWVALHAAVVTRGELTLLLAGDSGCGKSTLAVEMVSRGWTLYGDELAFLKMDDDQQPVVLAGAAEADLWPNALEKLGIDHNTTFPGDGNRHRVRFTREMAAEPRPLSALISLSLHNKDDISVERKTGSKRFLILGSHLYQSHVAEVLLDKTAYFSIATAITRNCPFFSIKRPRDLWSLDAMSKRIETEFS